MEGAWRSREAAIRSAVLSFRQETDAAILAVQPLRIEIVRTNAAMTLEAFNTRHPSSVPIAILSNLNGIRGGATIPAGSLVKRIVGTPVR
jgi:predicted Zn-dependent protease